MYISSPRAPRSSHHRSSSTRSSPRQRDRVRSFGGQRPNQPNFEGSSVPPMVPENLQDDHATFNVDPTAGVLESGGETYQPHIEPAGRRNFVGGFVVGLRKAWQRNRAPEEAIAFPEPAVVHDEETQYESVPRAEPEMQYASATPAPEAQYAAPLPDATYTAPSPGAQYATPAQYTSVGPDAEYPKSPERDPHRRQESSSSTSETVHAATTQEHYDGTTVVNHDMIPSGQIGSPQYVEPQPGSDYAKMDSPPRSEASFGSYMTRIHRFFQTINDLPWVAPDRVTVDYIPGKARQADGPIPRRRPARRPIISWYNSNIPQGSIDLLSEGATNSPLVQFPEAKPATPMAGYADVGYANNIPVPISGAGPPPPPMASRSRGMASQPQSARLHPHRVPVPHYNPFPEPEPTPEEVEPDDGYYSPRYPNGYVPYDQLDPAQRMAQTYTGSSGAPSFLSAGQGSHSVGRSHRRQASGAL